MFDLVTMGLLAGSMPSARTYAFTVNNVDGSISALNISSPSSITFSSELTDATYLVNPVNIGVHRSKKTAWVIGGGYITSVNISNPASMSRSGSLLFTNPVTMELDTDNSIMMIHNGSSIYAINISNPASPSSLGNLSTHSGGSWPTAGNFAIALDTTSRIAYIMQHDAISGTGPIRIAAISYSNPASMSVLGTRTLTNAGSSGAYGGLCLHPNRQTLFVAYGAGDFSVVNVSNPASMTESYNYTALFTLGGPGRVCYMSGDYVVVGASSDDAMKTLNVSNLASVTVVDTESGTTYLDNCQGIAVDPYNNTIYVAAVNGDDFSRYTTAAGVMTFGQNYTSATNINGPQDVALY